MAQSFSEYYKNKHENDTTAAANTGSSMSFTEYYQQKQAQKQRDTLAQQQQQQNAYQQQNADYINFISGLEPLGNNLSKNYNTRRSNTGYRTYSDALNELNPDINAIDTALKQGYASRWAYKQNEQGFDEIYGSGTTQKYLDSINKGIEYLESVRKSLNDEANYWRNIPDEQTYNKQQLWFNAASRPDFEEKSAYKTTERENAEAERNSIGNRIFKLFFGYDTASGFDDLLYDYINGNEKAQELQAQQDLELYYDNHEHYKNLDENTIKTFNYIYATEGKEAAYEYINAVTSENRTVTPIRAALAGATQGSGLSSAAELLSLGIGAISGDAAFNKSAQNLVNELETEKAIASRDQGIAYGAGDIAGFLALNATLSPAAGAAGQAAAQGVGKLITNNTVKAIAADATKRAVTGALTYATSTAIQNAGTAASGKMSAEDYVNGILASGAAGVAGGIAGSLTDQGFTRILVDKKLQTPFMEFVRQTTTSSVSSAAHVGAYATVSNNELSDDEIARQLVVSFAFSTIAGATAALKNTATSKAQIDQAVNKATSDYEYLTQNWDKLSSEERAARANTILEYTKAARRSINGRYIAGQQETVNQMNAAFDIIEKAMQQYASPDFGTAAYTAGSALPNASTNALATQINNAMQQGAQDYLNNGGNASANVPATINTAAISEMAQTLKASGNTAEQAVQAAPIVEAVIQGQAVTNAQAKIIATNEPAIEIINNTLGATINIADSVSTVTKDIMTLANRAQPVSTAAPTTNAVNTQTPANAVSAPSAAMPETQPTNTTATAALIDEYASQFGENGAKALKSYYTENTDAAQYAREMTAYYNAGMNDTDVLAVPVPASGDVLTVQQKSAAYTAGRIDAFKIANAGQMQYNKNNKNMEVMANGQETGQRSDTLRQGSVRDVPQRQGEQAGGISRATEAVRRRWDVSGTPKDSERGNLKYAEEIDARSLFKEAEKGQTVYKDVSKTKHTEAARALAKKNGYDIELWGGGEIRINKETAKINGNDTIRSFALISENRIGIQTDNAFVAADDLTRHEIMEQKIGHGEIDADTVLEEAAKYVDSARINRVITDLYVRSLGGNNKTGAELAEIEIHAKDELVCDGADHINQLRPYADAGVLTKEFTAFADVVDEVIAGINRAANELTGGAFELEGETRFSKQLAPNGTLYIKLDGNIFVRPDGTEMTERDAYRALEGTKITLTNGDEINIIKALPGKSMYDELFKRRPSTKEKINLAVLNEEINKNFLEILENSANTGANIPDIGKCHAKMGVVSFDKETVNIADNTNAYTLDLSIANLNDGTKIAYAKKYIRENKRLWESIQKIEAETTGSIPSGSASNGDNFLPSANRIPQTERAVNTQNAKKTDASSNTRFSMKLPIEEDDRMIAWHNIDSSAIDSAIELGGLAMPSWAVKRANSVHGTYGDISVIANKDTIDPKRSNAQKIFAGDAWTPVFPSVDYKVNYDAAKAVSEKVENLLAASGATKGDFRIALDTENIADALARNGGNFADIYKRNDGMRLAFLTDTGRGITVPKQEKKFSRHTDNKTLKEIARKIPDIDKLDSEEEMKHEPLLRSILHNYALKNFGQNVADDLYPTDEKLTFSTVDSVMYAAKNLMRADETQVVDMQKLGKRLDAAMSSKKINAEYEAWLKELGKDLVEKKGIQNNADMFSPSGNRRSFEALHYDYNLANIVRAMQGQPKQGRTQFLSGAASVKGAALKEYGSIEGVRAELNRLSDAETEESRAVYDKFSNDTLSLANKVSDDPFTGSDIIAEVLSVAKTVPAIERYLNREYRFLATENGLNISTLAKEMYELGQEANTLPMEYFEAKTYRAFPFSEAAAVVVPNTLPKETRQKLIDLGANVVVYKAGDNADRLKKVNSVPDARFSSSLNPYEALAAENAELKNKLADYKDLQQKLKNKTQQAAYWKEQTKITTVPTVRREDVNRLTKNIIENYDSTVKAAAISERIQELGNYIVSGNEYVWSDLKEQADDIARDIVKNASALVNPESEDIYSELKRQLAGNELLITRSQARDIPDYNEWHKHLPRYVKVRYTDAENGGNIDKAYTELQESYPWLFDDASGAGEKLQNIVEAMRSLEPIYDNPYDLDMAEAIEHCANEIIDGLMDESVRQSAPTFADKQERRLIAQRQKDAERIIAIKEDRDNRINNIKQHYQEMAEKKRVARIDSEKRTRLLKIAQRLNNKKLPAVSRALVQQYIGELDLVAKSLTSNSLSKLLDLEDWYMRQANNNPDFISDPVIEKKLQRLAKKQINDLTAAEVADLTDALLNIENELRTQRKLINSQERRDTYAAGQATIIDIENSKGGKGGKLDDLFVSGVLTPTRELHRITGYVDNDPLYIVGQELADGYLKMLDYQYRANKKFATWLEDKEFIKHIAGKDAQEIKISGLNKNTRVEVSITPAMRMSLYLHSLNDQNLRHIASGGITVPDIELYKKGKFVEAYNQGITIKLTPSEIKSIVANMSAKEKAFINAAYDYYNGQSRDEINATSELLKGYSLASVDSYFPIDTDRSFLRTDFDSIKRDGTIEGMGFLKERINALNPIMLYDLNDVLTKSIKQHSKYVGLAIPVRNFGKIWGATTGSFDEKGNFNGYEDSVQKAVRQKWGQAAYDYIENFMADLNNPAAQKDVLDKIFADFRSRYAGAVLVLNASVAIKQAASYPTAGAVVGFKPLLLALMDTSKVDLDLIAKYTPLLWYRSQGYSSQELGEMAQRGVNLPKALNWIQGVDVATTTKLWKAAEYYVRDNNKALAIGSDTYYKEVAKVYNRIIEETQPNYTTMQRPALLRSKSEVTRALNMFKTQPFQNFNILYDAIENMNAKRRAYTNSGSDESKQAYEEAKRNTARAISSQIVAGFVFSLMQFAWDFFRGKDKKYRDDEGDYTLWSWLKGMGFNMLSNGFGMFPFGTEVLELGEALADEILQALGQEPFFETNFYGVNVTATETFTNLGEDILQLVDVIKKISESKDGSDWESVARQLYGISTDITQLLGIPADNVKKTIEALATQIFRVTQGEYVGGYNAMRITSDPKKYSSDYYNLLYKAYTHDKTAYEQVYKMMIESGAFDETKIADAMEERMKAAESVKSAKDLENRYLSPERQREYNKGLKSLQDTSLWQHATSEQKGDALDLLYGLSSGSNATAVQSARAKIAGGKEYGLNQTEYILYKVALSMADEPTPDGKYGSYTNEEVEEAIRMLQGLSDAERDYLWRAQGKNEKNTPRW